MKNKLFFATPYDLGDFNDDEINTKPSMTVPNQVEPIAVIIERLAQGLPVTMLDSYYESEGKFSDDEYEGDITGDNFDMTDAKNFSRYMKRKQKQNEANQQNLKRDEVTEAPKQERSASGGAAERSEAKNQADK